MVGPNQLLGVAIESNGDLLVDSCSNLFRLTSAGTIDQSFAGGAGLATFPSSSEYAWADADLVIDGSLVLVPGQSWDGMSVLAYTLDGTLDASFVTSCQVRSVGRVTNKRFGSPTRFIRCAVESLP